MGFPPGSVPPPKKKIPPKSAKFATGQAKLVAAGAWQGAWAVSIEGRINRIEHVQSAREEEQILIGRTPDLRADPADRK